MGFDLGYLHDEKYFLYLIRYKYIRSTLFDKLFRILLYSLSVVDSQQDLAKLLDTSYTVIGKYERDEMKPSIDVANKLAKLVDTTVGYLLDESKNTNALKDPAMLKRLNDINSFTEKEREHILYALDALIKNAKLNSISN